MWSLPFLNSELALDNGKPLFYFGVFFFEQRDSQRSGVVFSPGMLPMAIIQKPLMANGHELSAAAASAKTGLLPPSCLIPR